MYKQCVEKVDGAKLFWLKSSRKRQSKFEEQLPVSVTDSELRIEEACEKKVCNDQKLFFLCSIRVCTNIKLLLIQWNLFYATWMEYVFHEDMINTD